MKIRVESKSYDEVMGLTTWKHKKPVKQSPFLRRLMYTLSKPELKEVDFECKEIDMDKLGKDEPCLFLMNHSSFTDLNITSVLLKNRHYHIVCTNDGLVGKEWLMTRLGCIPTKKFITDIALVKDMKYCFEELNSSVLMFPEASYSFDGTKTPLPESLSKCIKMMKVPVVMIKTDGSFLRDPLYNNLQKRKTKVTATMQYLISKEDCKNLSKEKISDILNQAFSFDYFREQEQKGVIINEDFRADGLHRVLYKCPSCGKEGRMEGKGVNIICKECKEKHELCKDGTLKSLTGETRFKYVSDWYKWERECVRNEILNDKYSFESPVNIKMLVDSKCIYDVGTGNLKHDENGFKLKGCDGKLDFSLSGLASYSLYADYFWYELGDMVCIGDTDRQYYCFPVNQESTIVAKLRLATEEMYKIKKSAG